MPPLDDPAFVVGVLEGLALALVVQVATMIVFWPRKAVRP